MLRRKGIVAVSWLLAAQLCALASCTKSAEEKKRSAAEERRQRRQAALVRSVAKRIAPGEIKRAVKAKAVSPIRAAKTPKDPKRLVASCAKRKGGKRLAEIVAIEARQELRGAHSLDSHTMMRYPDKLRVDYRVEGELVRGLVLSGGRAVQLSKGARRELEGASLGDVKLAAAVDTLAVLRAASRDGAKLSYLGGSSVDGKAADAVRVDLAVGQATLFIGVAVPDLLAVQYKSSRGLTTVIASDLRLVSGLRVAHRTRIQIGPTETVATLKEIKLNPRLSDDTFVVEKHPLAKK